MAFAVAVPPGTASETVEDTQAREARAARDLAEQGHLLRLWTLPGAGRALGLWRARDAGQLDEVLSSLPVAPWGWCISMRTPTRSGTRSPLSGITAMRAMVARMKVSSAAATVRP